MAIKIFGKILGNNKEKSKPAKPDVQKPNVQSAPEIEEGAVFVNKDNTFTVLSWDELMMPENGKKYGYHAELIGYSGIGYDEEEEYGAFEFCSKVVSIALPESITEICNYAFWDCDLAKVKLSRNLRNIGENAFLDCNGIENINFQECLYLDEIGMAAFMNCKSLIAADLSKCTSLEVIKESAFEDSKIETVTIPKSVRVIEENAFSYCKFLESINYKGTMSQWKFIKLGEDWNDNVPATYVQCSDGQVALS